MSRRLYSLFAVFLMISAGLAACDDDAPATAAGGAGGRGGSGGATGTGTGGRGGGGAAGNTGGRGGGGVDAAGAGGAGGSGLSDAFQDGPLDAPPESPGPADAGRADGTLPPDAAPFSDTGASLDTAPPADTSAGAVTVVQDCAEVTCPRLVAAAGSCSGDESACTAQVLGTDPDLRTNYCHANGVKKRSTTTTTASGYRTVMTVSKNGSDCYTLEMVSSQSGVENWTFRAPAGEELGRAVSTMDGNKLVLTCDGRTYDVSAVGCPGTDGEPGVGECTMGNCP